ncbi:hypothetical protein SBRY_20858 [Actinacidiphila bryophytorum]|uniref:Uncharacterized protein n=1 Tax=Actinacidiphila bryophytorum TaxID=1436133 RepID=A0A9W4EDW7_9ACTN|nr:hypothetical protein SBRY_20858 [Actinacidiphila bryophytorum]
MGQRFAGAADGRREPAGRGRALRPGAVLLVRAVRAVRAVRRAPHRRRHAGAARRPGQRCLVGVLAAGRRCAGRGAGGRPAARPGAGAQADRPFRRGGPGAGRGPHGAAGGGGRPGLSRAGAGAWAGMARRRPDGGAPQRLSAAGGRLVP